MTQTLMVLVNEAMNLEKMMIESGGEITPEIEAALAVKEVSLPEKVDGYSYILDRMSDMEEHFKARAEFFKEAAKHCKAAHERLTYNIKYAMQEMGTNELQGHDVRFKLAPTQGTLAIQDEEMVPVEFKKEIITTEIDKKALKEALVKGEVPGATLTPGFSLRTYANTATKKKAIGA